MEQVLNPEFIKYIVQYLSPAVIVTIASIYGFTKVIPTVPGILKGVAEIINAQSNRAKIEAQYKKEDNRENETESKTP